jgi:hypothetical protein
LTLSQENSQFKIKNSLHENFPKKLITRKNMHPNTLTRQQYKSKFMLKILVKKFM